MLVQDRGPKYGRLILLEYNDCGPVLLPGQVLGPLVLFLFEKWCKGQKN